MTLDKNRMITEYGGQQPPLVILTKEHNTPKAVQDYHALLKWVIAKIDTFARNCKFTLGDKIENALMFVLERLVKQPKAKINGGC